MEHASPRGHHRACLVAGLLGLVLGCAPSVQPFVAGGGPPLAETEGLLILHVDTDVAVGELVLSSGSVAKSLQQGEHVWLVRAKAGGYRWSTVRFGAQAGAAHNVQLGFEDEFRFEVVAGKLNYAGALIIRSPHANRSVKGSVRIRHRNHAAMAIRRLRERHPSVLAEMPLHHGGAGGDRFFEYYERMRDAVPVGEPEAQ